MKSILKGWLSRIFYAVICKAGSTGDTISGKDNLGKWFIETISRKILIKRNQKRFERDQVGGGMHMFWRKVSRHSCMHVFLTTNSFIIDGQLIISSELLFSNESQLEVLFNQS